MSFFGILIAITSIIAVAYSVTLINQQTQSSNKQIQQFAEYSNLIEVETFYNVVEDPGQNLTANMAWVSAIKASAKVDGVSIDFINNTVLINPSKAPHISGVIKISN